MYARQDTPSGWPDTDHAVLVTGASSGIGAATAGMLARAGFRVYGGLRNPADRRRLEAAGVIPIILDVTDAAGRSDALSELRGSLGQASLWGLVNNAGVSTLGPLETMPLDELRRVMEVNLWGGIAMAQACLPLLRVSRGRIVNIGSTASRQALPYLGAYAASKAALAAVSDSLRLELRPAGVDVVLVLPAAVRTGLATSLRPPTEADGCDPMAVRGAANLHRELLADAARGPSADVVAQAVLHALTTRHPPARMTPTAPSWRSRLSTALPSAWRERRMARWVWGRDA